MNVIALNGTLWDAICVSEQEAAHVINECVMASLASIDVYQLDWANSQACEVAMVKAA